MGSNCCCLNSFSIFNLIVISGDANMNWEIIIKIIIIIIIDAIVIVMGT